MCQVDEIRIRESKTRPRKSRPRLPPYNIRVQIAYEARRDGYLSRSRRWSSADHRLVLYTNRMARFPSLVHRHENRKLLVRIAPDPLLHPCTSSVALLFLLIIRGPP